MDSDRLDARAIIDQLKSDPRFKRFERPERPDPASRTTSRVYRDEPIIMTGSQMASFLPPAYREARALARSRDGEQMPPAQLFLTQGRMLADLEDDAPYAGTFERYYPTYQMMSDRRLRGYVTWRTQVRRGEVAQAPTSFLFVYCYELLNGIGMASPQDVFSELRRFWGAYRGEESLLDRYVPRWLWDLAAYHGLDRALIAEDPDLSKDIAYDEALHSVLHPEGVSEAELFCALDTLSAYHVLKSRFYKEHPEDLRAVTFAVLGRLGPYYAKHRTRGLYEGFFGESLTLPHRMFEAAVFYEELPHPDAEYRFDVLQRYRCADGRWERTFYPEIRSGSARLGAILKAVDAQMRDRYGFAHPLKAPKTPKYLAQFIEREIDERLAWNKAHEVRRIQIDRSKLQGGFAHPLKAPKTPKYLAQFIEREIDERLAWNKAHEVRRIQIDRSKLQGIRSTAEVTREALLVDEERAEAPAPLEPQPPAAAAAPKSVGEKVAAPAVSAAPIAPSAQGEPQPEGFSTAPFGLDGRELAFVLRLLDGGSVDDLLSGTLTAELLVDAVNEKLFDLLGDTAVEFVGSQPRIVEDYWDDVKGAVCP